MTPHHAASLNPFPVIAIPLLAGLLVALKFAGVVALGGPVSMIVAVVLLFGTVFCAVHHAEVVAHRVGEPFGSLVLAVSVTIIEVALIVTIMMTSADSGGSEVARDTVFAALMIVLTGIVGISLLVGGLIHREQDFHAKGATAALSALATLSALALILPKYTIAVPGPYYSTGQLLAVGLMALTLYMLFIFVQSIHHRDYFLDADDEADDHAVIPMRAVLTSLAMLIVSLLAVVLISKALSPAVEKAVLGAGLPLSFVGVIIASVILLPEGIAAVRAARQNRFQQSLNLALGSGLAGIGLTIPTVAITSVVLGIPLGLGLEDEHMLLLVLALFISALTVLTGRTNIMLGGIHLVVFVAFLVISAVP